MTQNTSLKSLSARSLKLYSSTKKPTKEEDKIEETNSRSHKFKNCGALCDCGGEPSNAAESERLWEFSLVFL